MRSVLECERINVFQNVSAEIEKADINLCNIETVASNIGFSRFWLPSFEMRGNPDQLSLVKEVGFNVFGVANNHAMQHGKEAFEDMVANISKTEASIIGIDLNEGRTVVREFKHGDGEVSAIFAVSIRPEEWTTQRPVPYSLRESEDSLISEVVELRQRYTGFLVCSIHWGLEFLEYPSTGQVELGRRLVDAGVDVVFGHHPHVLQPVERYKTGLIFYSLGNFVFDLWPESTKLTAVAKVRLEQGVLPAFEIIPMTIGNDLKLYKAGEKDSKRILKMMSWSEFQRRENVPKTDCEYEERYKIARLEFRYSSYRYFLSNIRKYPVRFLFQSLARTGIRRLLGR